MALLLVIAFAGLGYRLVDLQVLRHDNLSAKAERNTQKEWLLEPRRGDILDAKGNLLATVKYVKTICGDPSLAGTNYLEIARVLAPVLEESEAKLAAKLKPGFCKGPNGEVLTNQPIQWAELKKRVDEAVWQRARAAITNLVLAPPGKKLTKREALYYATVRDNVIYSREEQSRVYPNGDLAAHVLGFTTIEERAIKNRFGNNVHVSEIAGLAGIEQSFNEKLAGVRGWRVTAVGESLGEFGEVVSLREQNVEAQDGFNVVLTVDSVIQDAVETALAEAMTTHTPISASCLVVRPKTGEILAMATMPNYDPSKPATATRNRLISDRVEPGSTFKIVVVSAALNEGLVKLTDVFDCEQGRFHYGGRILQDHERYGALSVERIITKSSNIGAAKIGLLLGQERLYDYIRQFGFGANTGLPMIGEVPGLVRPVKDWNKISIVQLPMGHGLTVTPLQMTMAMCALANKGVLMRPMIVDRLEDRNRKAVAKYAPQEVRRVVSEDAARLMVKALKTVTSPEGTAPKAAMEHYSVAGKTGTAQKVENGVYVRKYFSSFIGFFPADNPELCITVVLDEPKNGYYGGQSAGPIFKQIAERAASYLSIPPDLNPDGEPSSPLAATAVETKTARPGSM